MTYKCIYCNRHFTAEQVKTLLVPVLGSEHNTHRQMFTSPDRRQLHDLMPVSTKVEAESAEDDLLAVLDDGSADHTADPSVTVDRGTF